MNVVEDDDLLELSVNEHSLVGHEDFRGVGVNTRVLMRIEVVERTVLDGRTLCGIADEDDRLVAQDVVRG
eukprot:15599759-Heterocapsa_arctica.AAC.1